jgi:hypothetical protein
MDEHAGTGRHETELERVDRNYTELLGELRVALPGVQVLFAFLLVVPFNARFNQVTAFQEKVYFATLLCTAVASAFLIAPSVHHRLLFRQRVKEKLVMTAHWMALVGLSFLALAIIGVLLLVTDFLFEATAAAVVTVLASALVVVVWYALPMQRRLRG